ncbi:hypothetical protein E3U43_003565 [Larimichthys crocea]|uniref:Uncharacterized protein n=1 Tax=Larimichthys crocea TaxID=215358 RepID=A0ACD3RIE0_LARCR|nr:hypothetical protein E3U43_003565 [Larimichthys crocea]
MTSGGLGLTEGLGEDISQEELDFSDLFLYNSPGEDFPVGCDKDDSGALLQNDNQPLLLVVDHHTAYISNSNQPVSTQDLSSHSTTTEPLSGAVFDSLGLASRPGTIPAPSPRIEITPSGDSLSSQTLQPSPGTKALGAYRECVSPASTSPCVSPSMGGCGMGLSGLDLCPSLQGIHTSSTHSSPGASPRNSITDETYLQPQHPTHHLIDSPPALPLCLTTRKALLWPGRFLPRGHACEAALPEPLAPSLHPMSSRGPTTSTKTRFTLSSSLKLRPPPQAWRRS